MTQDNMMDRDIYDIDAGALARVFSGIAEHIKDEKPLEAYRMAIDCAREFSRMAANGHGEWRPLSDIEFEKARKAATERLNRTHDERIRRGLPVAHLRG